MTGVRSAQIVAISLAVVNVVPIIAVDFLIAQIFTCVWDIRNFDRPTRHATPGWRGAITTEISDDESVDLTVTETGLGTRRLAHRAPLDYTSTRRRKCAKGLGDEWLALVSPLEGLGHGVVVVIDEGQNLGLQLVKRRERASAQEFTGQNAEPDFDLVEPG